MSINRFLSLFIALILVAGVRAGAANAANLSSCVQRQSGFASVADIAALDWVGRHAASLTAAPDWVARYAASLKASNAMDLSNCFQRQPGFASAADTAALDWVGRHVASLTAAPDWVARHAASLKAVSAASLSDY